ncbi:hypothetical protein FB451DRAFT_1373996 [Mycena latifolia]|nr:hypothetical protein FB451DRAFT_1373996 [Mycena latifolia]
MSSSSSPAADADAADPVIVVLTPDTATVGEALAARAAKRQAIKSRKRAQAKDRQAFGVTLMKIKNYEGAAGCFADACGLWRANPVAHCDLATAYLHLGRFEDAEKAASAALALDPKLVEARYARAMARKGRGLVRGAIADFQTVLQLAPENAAAQAALRDLEAAPPPAPDAEEAPAADEGAAPPTDESAAPPAESDEPDYALPLPTAPPHPPSDASGSDTSDAQHRGSGVPCLFYNHGGCARGSSCRFSHAPDEKSVRDGLASSAKSASTRTSAPSCRRLCPLRLRSLPASSSAPSSSSLPTPASSAADGAAPSKTETETETETEKEKEEKTEKPWWDDESRVAEMRARIEGVKLKAREKRERREQREKEAAASGEGRGKGRGKGKKKGKGRGARRAGDSSASASASASYPNPNPNGGWGMPVPGMGFEIPGYDLTGGMGGGMGMGGGFTEYELNELAAQGVKPWDGDALAVLAALSY